MKLEKAIAVSKPDVIDGIVSILNEEFQFSIHERQVARLEHFINRHVDGLYYFLEFPYVDKVYRDSYYNYFSMKNYPYIRDCLKVGAFSCEISFDDFFNPDRFSYLQENFMGFFIIRPTSQILGRTILSPGIFKDSSFYICEATFKITMCYRQFSVNGFPHASQDIETMTCGETSIWALLEYYGHKKPHYQTTLPSKINAIINELSHVRSLPSDGVGLSQISSTVKRLGFSTKLYAKESFKDDFYEILSCYIESGIPILTVVDNHTNGDGHAILCIGHEHVLEESYEKYWKPEVIDGVEIYDNDSVMKNFIFIDDNMSPYQKSFLTMDESYKKMLAKHNKETSFIKYNITHFIVPLHNKVFLDAHHAKEYVKAFLTKGPVNLRANNDDEYTIRVFLTAGRSYKQKLVEENLISNIYVKEKILDKPFPNFVWIAEISTREKYIKQKILTGLIIIDATEADTSVNRGLLLATMNNYLIAQTDHEEKLKRPFESKLFCNNLKKYQ
jgi:hypothetical protein